MVDRYYRKIENIGNDIENSIQISGILLKLKGYDEKLSDLSKIWNNENNISSNLSKIGDNENNISSNSKKITNEGHISSNLGIINTNEGNIASNLEQITDIKSLLPASETFKKAYTIKTNHLNLLEI